MDPSLAAAVLAVCKLAFAAAGLAAGVAVLRLARAEEGLEEHTLAALAIASGSLGLALFPLDDLPLPSVLRESLAATGELLLRVAFVLLAVFVWRVFRPAGRAGAAAAAACAMGLVTTLVWELRAQPSLADYDATLASAWCAQVSFAVPFAWSSVETALEWSRARRRVALGLADPLVAGRFGLWMVATAALTGACLLANAVAWAQVHERVAAEAWLTFARGLLYLPAIGAIWLGFFPPRWYRRVLGAEASAPS